MFSLFGLSHVSCPRCHCASADDVGQCAQCGYTISAGRSDPVLRDNRWLPADDELALFCSVNQSGSVPRLHVPASARAYLLHNEKLIELPGDEQAQAGVFSQLKSLLQAKRADVLIARQNTFVLDVTLDDLHSAEFMKIAATFSISIKIDQVEAFARQFMGAPGSVTCQQVQQLLVPSVRHIAAAFFGAHSLREMQDNAELCQQIDERLCSALNTAIAVYGLAVTQVATRQLRHDKLSVEREHLGEKIGTLWLVVEGKRAQLAHGKRLDALYSIEEWQKIAHEEQQIRLRYRREEMRQKFGKDLGWLYLHGECEDAKKRLSRAKLKQDENERLQTIRARELELYSRIADAATRKEAIARGAADSIKELEHAFKDKAEQRQNAADQWLHVRTMARIKMRTESEITQLEGKQAAQALQQSMEHQRQKNQLEHEMAQAQQLEDQQQRRAQTESLQRKQEHLARREQELADEEQKNNLLYLSIEAEAKAREFQRLQAWEEETQRQKKQAIKREEEQADALASHEKLLRTLQVQASFERQSQQQRHQAEIDQVETEKRRLILRQDEDERRWRREQQTASAEHAHEALLARMAIERISVIANLSETGKVATADWQNATALADILKLQAQAAMSAEQILATQAGLSPHAAQAMSAIATIQQGMTSAQAITLLQERLSEDRAYSERQAEHERRHQIDLAVAQNAAGNRSANTGQTGRK